MVSVTTDHPETVISGETGIYRIGAYSSLLMLMIIVVQVAVYIAWPPPDSAEEFFDLLIGNRLLGLLSLDLLYIISNSLLIPMYLAFFFALKRVNISTMSLALVVGLLGVGAYYPSNPAFEMLSFSGQYSAAATEMQRSMLLASGQTMLAIYKGTSFNVYYVLNAIALLMFAYTMLRCHIFSKGTAYMGLLAGALMAIPSSAGAIGRVFALLSLIPWCVFTAMVARRFLQLWRSGGQQPI